MRKEVKLIKPDQLEWNAIAGGFKYKFIGEGEKFLTGIGVAQPGGGETWHKHTAEVEETYYVLKGKGTLWWRSEGKEHALEFSEGDALYLPCGCENQFINTGDGELRVLFTLTRATKYRE